MNFLINLIFAILIITIIVVWSCLWLRFGGEVKVVGDLNRPLEFLRGHTKLTYFPHVLFGIFPKINVEYASKKNRNKKFRPVRELLSSGDGGEFGIDWFYSEKTNNKNAPENTPILVVSHGMSGGSNESYVQKMCLRVANEFGWRVVCIVCRGCCGTALKTPRIYHSGFTEDLHIILETLSMRYPTAPISVLGYCLGANVVTKYFGERNSRSRPTCFFSHVKNNAPIPRNVIAAAAVCCPFDFKNVEPYLQPILGDWHASYLRKHRDVLLPSYPEIDNYLGLKNKSCDIFDTWFTTKMFDHPTLDALYADNAAAKYIDGVGYRSADEKLLASSSSSSTSATPLRATSLSLTPSSFSSSYPSPSPCVSSSSSSSSSSPSSSASPSVPDGIPLLFISAANDPFFRKGSFPTAAVRANPFTAALIPKGGAHLGFFSPLDTARLWDEDMLLRYFTYEVGKCRLDST